MALPAFGFLLTPNCARTCAIVDDTLDQNLHGAAGFLAAEKPRGHDARIVEDEQIAIAKIVGDIGELPVRERFFLHVDNSNRLAERCGNGACAISSAGRS